MKKGELIESIYLNISGGKLTDDVNVQREDIATYLTEAINYAIVARHRQDKREARLDGIFDNSLAADLKKTYRVEVKKDCDRDLSYVELPVPIQSLDRNQGLVSVFPIKGGNPFKKVGGPNHFQGLSIVFSKTTLFWYEDTEDGVRVFIKNISPTVKEVNMELVPSIPELKDEDELPIPTGMGVEIIDLCVKYFRMQRFNSPDYINDNTDDAQTRK